MTTFIFRDTVHSQGWLEELRLVPEEPEEDNTTEKPLFGQDGEPNVSIRRLLKDLKDQRFRLVKVRAVKANLCYEPGDEKPHYESCHVEFVFDSASHAVENDTLRSIFDDYYTQHGAVHADAASSERETDLVGLTFTILPNHPEAKKEEPLLARLKAGNDLHLSYLED